ncbi:DNA/RNA non-specific endonuclease [Streptococcus acidominimus]|uniref:Type VII secretion system protein EssD-like domain-containing protein n=1 Tax=Streptococcus acidominimus TaxID=1326 RepID=A0A4Y9FNR4_STRAI|nr:DNA/RNA non-specific endonuclease [Streptococcus acidominimus]MBF0818686.1 DNA/RNA non-specific endonuclease [Streptococcus acidominimus]MBF0839854.1 DNA/RNA non-specific endonuclease [Streptococcus acidominimus]MBF0846316.1 DNA/RNA non-specific endonuclease [Streptococcus danieliae]TFU30855.1 hypothetical protein E4U01_04350 [Streptococcus acidominimus]
MDERAYQQLLSQLEYKGSDLVFLNDEDSCRQHNILLACEKGIISYLQDLKIDTPEFFSHKNYRSIKEGDSYVWFYQAQGMEILLTRRKEGKKLKTTRGSAAGMSYGRGKGNNSDFYHRCHLLGEQIFPNRATYLKGEYIVGTAYLNIDAKVSMLTYENKIVNILKKQESKIFYKVTPIFKDGEVIARGVRMTARSFNDEWKETEECRFDVYLFNRSPGYRIDYKTGSITECKEKI